MKIEIRHFPSHHFMLDIHFIREHADVVKKAVKNKGIELDIDKILSLDATRRDAISEIETLRQQRNTIADQLKDPKQRTQQLMEQGKELKEITKTKEEHLAPLEKELQDLLWRTPNIPSDDTPIGRDASDNREVRCWGKIPRFDFPLRDHIELAKINDWIDFERGVKVHGYRGYFLKNEAALFQMQLILFLFEKMYKKGYKALIPPTIVKERVLWGTGMLPFGEGDMFEIQNTTEQESGELIKERLLLAGTSEVGIAGLFMDEILSEEDLPLRFVGFSPCFRREVGGYGKDTKGIYRVHEFFKIEQFIICKNDYEESERLHQELLADSEDILQALKIPYRVIQICTGDMGPGKYKMFDLESWMPSRNAYGETHSCSNLSDWQARRLNIRYKEKNGALAYVHTLNNTALAFPRILIPILELNQDREGTVSLPEV